MDAVERHRVCYKKTTPPWKETYRKRCVDRLKNSRFRLLERYRQTGESPLNGSSRIVQEVMEEEWTALQTEEQRLPSLWGPHGMAEMLDLMKDSDELQVLEEIQQELVSQEMAIIEEFESNLELEQQYLSSLMGDVEAMHIICPICQSNNLSINNYHISCLCGLCINTEHNITPDALQRLLESSVSKHMENCLHKPVFSLVAIAGPENSPNLMLSCQVCDHLSVVL